MGLVSSAKQYAYTVGQAVAKRRLKFLAPCIGIREARRNARSSIARPLRAPRQISFTSSSIAKSRPVPGKSSSCLISALVHSRPLPSSSTPNPEPPCAPALQGRLADFRSAPPLPSASSYYYRHIYKCSQHFCRSLSPHRLECSAPCYSVFVLLVPRLSPDAQHPISQQR